MIIVDNYHKVSSSGAGDNYHLNLDGILFLGMFDSRKREEIKYICYRWCQKQHVQGTPKTIDVRIWIPGMFSELGA